jgi:hypothetical protein
MKLQPNDLILEIIGTPTTPLCIPGAIQTKLWHDARIGDATLHVRFENPSFANAALEYIRTQGLTPIGARLVQPQSATPVPRVKLLKPFRQAA